ncbi:hypothetical protein [Microbacterium abyssi]|uniref:hypothetical protein n=1 Tax=Microbacterium abyssi TaxID=2782166 RepID=UPI0018875DD2|nr:hypothetical protein [Microbacterium sp. A18JL241]
MKNSTTVLVLAAASLVMLAGCSTQAAEDAAPVATPAPTSPTFTCNLGWKHGADPTNILARYDEPTGDEWEEDYGAHVANPECTDLQILEWQKLRREAGESDEICRVTIAFTADQAHVLGCVVPVLVVSDAS